MTATIIEPEVTETSEDPDDVLHVVCCFDPDLPLEKMMTVCGVRLDQAGKQYGENEVAPEPPCLRCDELLYLHRLCLSKCIFRSAL